MNLPLHQGHASGGTRRAFRSKTFGPVGVEPCEARQSARSRRRSRNRSLPWASFQCSFREPLVVRNFTVDVCCYTPGQKSDEKLSIASLVSRPHRPEQLAGQYRRQQRPKQHNPVGCKESAARARRIWYANLSLSQHHQNGTEYAPLNDMTTLSEA